MIEDTPARYHAQPDEAHHARPANLPDDFEIVSTQPAPDPDFEGQETTAPRNRGHFRKGHDPRRHQLTHADRSKGFWTAIAVMGVSIGPKLNRAGRWPGFTGRRAGR